MRIKSSLGDYSIEEASSLEAALAACVGSRYVYAIADRKLFSLSHSSALTQLDASRVIDVEATEEEKSYQRIEWIFDQLLRSGFRRGCSILAIGGGVIQDIACFVASVLFRGVEWKLIPTTLLAQCDSCIGSKSSVNVGKFKNQIGTFHPPSNVVIVNSLLETLPLDDVRSGLGEVIKLHLVSGETDYRRVREHLGRGIPSVPELRPLVASSLSIKKRFIEEDEFDKGVRNLLNYGHTFGHAYESVTSYRIPHGIAVSLGVVSATFVSERMGLVPHGHFNEIKELALPYFSPFEKELSVNDVEAVIDAMRLDKKSTKSSINCILTRGPGKMEKVALSPDEQLKPLLSDLLTALCH